MCLLFVFIMLFVFIHLVAFYAFPKRLPHIFFLRYFSRIFTKLTHFTASLSSDMCSIYPGNATINLFGIENLRVLGSFFNDGTTNLFYLFHPLHVFLENFSTHWNYIFFFFDNSTFHIECNSSIMIKIKQWLSHFIIYLHNFVVYLWHNFHLICIALIC